MQKPTQTVLAERTASYWSFRNFYTLLLILTIAAALLCLAGTFRLLPAHDDNMYPEAAGVLSAQQWAQGHVLYQDYRQPPSLITHFPPLWYGFLALAVKAGISDMDSLTLVGRFLSLLFLVGAASLGYFWNRRLGVSPSLALFAPVIYLAFPIMVPWAATARPDFPGLYFAFLAIYVIALRPSKAAVCGAGVIAALAFLIRHNAVAAPAAIGLWLLWKRRWAQAVLFSVSWAVVVLPALLLFQSSSHGMLLLNLSGAKFGPIAITYIRDALFRLLVTSGHGFALLLFALGIFGLMVSWKDGDDREQLAGIYLVVSFAMATFGAAAAGAAVNHYLEPAFAMAVLAPAGLLRLRDSWVDAPVTRFAVVALAVLLLPSLDFERSNLMHDRPNDLRGLYALANDRATFTDIPYLAARMRSPEFLDLVSLTYSERTHSSAAWSSQPLKNALRDRKYEVLILHQPADISYDPGARYPRYPRLDGEVLRAINENYGYCFDFDGSYIYQLLPAVGEFSRASCPAVEGKSVQEAHTGKGIPPRPAVRDMGDQ
jgi:hypothetical protein